MGDNRELFKEIKSLRTTLVFYGAIIDSLLDLLYINDVIDKDEFSENLTDRITKIKQKSTEEKNAHTEGLSEIYWGEGGDA